MMLGLFAINSLSKSVGSLAGLTQKTLASKQHYHQQKAGVNLLRNVGVTLVRKGGVSLVRNVGVSFTGISIKTA